MNFVEFLKAVLYGIVQGITEWLPISSTGHLILLEQFNFMKMDVSNNFMKMFDVLIQFGSIMAVIILYFNKLNPFSKKKNRALRKETWSLWYKVLVGTIPAIIIGFLFKKPIKSLYDFPIIIAAALILYGILFIVIENRRKAPTIKNLDQINYKVALLMGVFQALALIPGTSRSGATIIGAIILGSSRYIAAEFSFFLAIPVMFGASLLEIVTYDGDAFSSNEIGILITGMIVAFIVSVFAIKFLMNYIKKHDFKIFGYYRIVLGLIVILYFAITGAKI